MQPQLLYFPPLKQVILLRDEHNLVNHCIWALFFVHYTHRSLLFLFHSHTLPFQKGPHAQLEINPEQITSNLKRLYRGREATQQTWRTQGWAWSFIRMDTLCGYSLLDMFSTKICFPLSPRTFLSCKTSYSSSLSILNCEGSSCPLQACGSQTYKIIHGYP